MSSNRHRDASPPIAGHAGSSWSAALFAQDERNGILNHLAGTILMVQSFDGPQLFAPLVRIVELTYVLLSYHDVLIAVDEIDGDIGEEIQVH